MPRLSKTIAGALLLSAVSLSAAGCAENESSLYVIGVFALSRTQCLAEPKASAVMLASGRLDRVLANGYSVAMLVGSQLTERGSREKLRTETSRLQIEGARVTLFATDGSSHEVGEVAATGLANPASGTDPGLAAVFAQLIRPQDMAALGAPGQAIARVRVFGTTLGGQEIESGDYDFPIEVCDGCLISVPPEAISYSNADGMPNTGDEFYFCDGSTALSRDADICYFGNDDPVPCTYCLDLDACRYPFGPPP